MADVTERSLREEELRRSEELFRRTFEAAAVGIAHLSQDGRWLKINDRLCEISGYPREKLLGMTYRDLALPEDAEAGEERLRRLLSGETGPYSVERCFVREDGSRVWVSISVSLVRKASGEPDYIVCTAEDVTTRKVGELLADPLTSRETEVLGRIVAGQTDPQMAGELPYSLGTVKRDVRRILAKLGVRDRKRAAVRAVEIGLAPPP